MKTLKTSLRDVVQTPKRYRICKSRKYLAQLSKRHLTQWYKTHFEKVVRVRYIQTSQQHIFQGNSKRYLESIFARCLLDALKMSDLQIQNTPSTAVQKTSCLLLHKTFQKNVSETSCKTDFKAFLESDLKAVAKLVNGFQPLTIYVEELHRKSSAMF